MSRLSKPEGEKSDQRACSLALLEQLTCGAQEDQSMSNRENIMKIKIERNIILGRPEDDTTPGCVDCRRLPFATDQRCTGRHRLAVI